MATREFTLSEGSSHKFWNITLNGKDHEVRYGRIGTAGQSQTKSFATEAEAKASHDKLIAEKVKKGYAEASAGSAPPAAPPKPAPPPKPPAAATSDSTDAGSTSPAVPAEDQAAAEPTEKEVLLEEPRRILLDAEDRRWAAQQTENDRKIRPAQAQFNFEDAARR